MKKVILVTATALVAVVSCLGQSKDERIVLGVLNENTAAFVRNDITALDRIWANDEAVTVFENGFANYGWTDYRNNHLAPEMKEFTNLSYAIVEPKIKLSGKTAWSTFKYTISGDSGGRHFDSGGLGTAILEKRSGRWLIVHWHTSAPRRAPAAAAPKQEE